MSPKYASLIREHDLQMCVITPYVAVLLTVYSSTCLQYVHFLASDEKLKAMPQSYVPRQSYKLPWKLYNLDVRFMH